MIRNSLFSMFAAALVFTSIPAGASPDVKAPDPTDKAFVGDPADKSEDIQILDAKDILLLDDQKLVDAYIDAIVEIEATKAFHSTSGFTPKEFKKYKKLLKYRLQLLFEVNRRKMALPAEVK